MGSLKVLPAQIANMIAAGEVVQRPASVVKELMENAVDAGAGKIDVILTDSGRTLIQVIDNGCGMSAADAVLCFERHATSKIATAEDLGNILTYGFRGEALASIAAVAEVTLKTRRAADETGTKVTFSDFNSTQSAPVAVPSGTNISVRNLFYNIPARRKFLKSDNVELRHCIEEFTHVAITRPDIEFSLSHNGRDIFVLKKAKSLKFRIQDLLGSSVTGDMADISATTSVAGISGFIGRPESAKKTVGNQFFFIGGRFFRSPYLHKAVMNAYSDLIPDGVTPSYFIFLDIDPHNYDVNVSPTKTEIKFEDESVLFQVLYACVKEALGKNSFGADLDFDTAGAVQMPQLGRSFEAYKNEDIAPSMEFDSDYDPFNPDGAAAPVQSAGSHYQPSRYTDRSENYGALFEQKTLPQTKVLILADRYIVTPVSSGLMLVSIRRATERILYEKYLRAISNNEHVTQTALFPEQVRVGMEQKMIFDENEELLRSLGFDITPFGNDTVVVGGVPEGFSCENGKTEQLVRDLLVILSDDKTALSSMMQSSLAERLASLAAAGPSSVKTAYDAQNLIDTLFGCDNSELTPKGHRIVSIISVDELEKKLT